MNINAKKKLIKCGINSIFKDQMEKIMSGYVSINAR